MKVLADFARDNGLIIVPIKYNFQGFRLRRNGYDLCRFNGEIIISIEPVNYRYDASKWYLTSKISGSDALSGSRAKRRYTKRITRAILAEFPLIGFSYCKNINATEEGKRA
jgi:hypothetical protein